MIQWYSPIVCSIKLRETLLKCPKNPDIAEIALPVVRVFRLQISTNKRALGKRPGLDRSMNNWAIFDYLRISLCLYSLGVGSQHAQDLSSGRKLSVQLAQSGASWILGDKLKCDLSRALVDWEQVWSFCNANIFTLTSCSRSSSSRWS